MNVGTLSPLIKTQPKRFTNARGVKQSYVAVYKDEGGKHSVHFEMTARVPHTTRRVSIGAFAECTDASCPQHCSKTDTPDFVSNQLFRVVECSRAGYRGPLTAAANPVPGWEGKSNLWSYDTFMDHIVHIKCNFLKVTSKCMCTKCGAETRFRVIVATDENCVDTSLPVRVLSKRKIPASMRKKSQREIKAFMDKSKSKRALSKCSRIDEEKGISMTTRTDKDPASSAADASQDMSCDPPCEDPVLLNMAKPELESYIKTLRAQIQEESQKVKALEAEMERQRHQLARAHEERERGRKRRKLSKDQDFLLDATPPMRAAESCHTPPTFFQFPVSQCEVVEPYSLFDDGEMTDMSEIGEIDFAGWDI